MPKKTMLIVNPVAGKGRVKEELLNILLGLNDVEKGVPVFLTEKKGDAASFVVNHGRDFERIICTGGDGTLCEVINGFMELPLEDRPELGYIPLGTGNYMASNLSISKTPIKALSMINTVEPHPIDVGCFDGKYFGYVAAFGAFTDISYETPQNVKNTFGFLAYLLMALNSVQKLSSFHTVVEYDGGTLEDNFIFGAVSNSTTVANIIKLNSDDVMLDDGLFEILLIRTPQRPSDLNKCVGDILTKKYDNENICLLHTTRIKFKFDEKIPWTLDGENGGRHSEVEAVNYRQAIKMLF